MRNVFRLIRGIPLSPTDACIGTPRDASSCDKCVARNAAASMGTPLVSLSVAARMPLWNVRSDSGRLSTTETAPLAVTDSYLIPDGVGAFTIYADGAHATKLEDIASNTLARAMICFKDMRPPELFL